MQRCWVIFNVDSVCLFDTSETIALQVDKQLSADVPNPAEVETGAWRGVRTC